MYVDQVALYQECKLFVERGRRFESRAGQNYTIVLMYITFEFFS